MQNFKSERTLPPLMVLEKAINLINGGDVEGFVAAIQKVMDSLSDNSYAKLCQHLHIKNPLGVKRPFIKKMADEIVKNSTCNRETFIKGGRDLWKTGVAENRRLAIFMLSYLIQRNADFPLVLSSMFIKKAASNCDSWELADDFGMNVLGLILSKDIYQLDEVLTWADGANVWLKRTLAVAAWGLYKHSKKKGENRVDCSLELLDKLMSSPEDEVKFGIMWPLRMLCKYEETQCIDFMKRWLQGDDNSRWIVENAARKLPAEQLLQILPAHEFSFYNTVCE